MKNEMCTVKVVFYRTQIYYAANLLASFSSLFLLNSAQLLFWCILTGPNNIISFNLMCLLQHRRQFKKKAQIK